MNSTSFVAHPGQSLVDHFSIVARRDGLFADINFDNPNETTRDLLTGGL